MPAQEFTPQMLVDSLSAFEAGVNNDISPLLLEKNQLASALNVTVRGTFATHRPPVRKVILNDAGKALLANALAQGPFQGGCYYKPDNSSETLIAAIAGRLFQILTPWTNGTVIEWTIPGDPNPSDRLQAWLWQSEKWVIWNDGISLPVFFDNITSRRSNYGSVTDYNTTVAVKFVVPSQGGTVSVTFTDATNVVVGDVVTISGAGTFLVQDDSATPVLVLVNVSAQVGKGIAAGKAITWQHTGTELPPGRMGAYGLGRNAMSLIDGKQFIMGDIVGSSSGTKANNYRDAVLNITENFYLKGGGTFTVPGNVGDIKAMRFIANLDTSLGQGPLQVLTHNTVFSCQSPVDRLIWQDITNPILTESLISNGGLGQNSTVLANGDLIFRSVDGIRSLILARREFQTWGNVPISQEVDPLLALDSPDLLQYGSAIVFDNRLLMTATPVLSDHGIYHTALVPINFDPISSLRGKAPSVYDSLRWTGLNIFQLVVGEFQNIQRAFAFGLNTITTEIELYEIQKSRDGINDNGNTRIVWSGESASLFKYPDNDIRKNQLKQLADGEIYVDQMQGVVDFQFFYKPDQWPCWVPWFDWQECAPDLDTEARPQYRPRMGLGEPSASPCDATNDRVLRVAKTFQIKWIITGHCRFLGAQFKAITVPQTQYAKKGCKPICET